MTHDRLSLGQAPASAPLTPARIAGLVALVAAATVLGALFIEHVLGVQPCELCLKERLPYYAGTPLALLSLALAARRPRGWPAVVALGLLALLFAGGSAVGVYHTGVEYGWWPGPTDCTGPVGAAAPMNDFLKQLETVKVVRCDEVAMRIFGLSLAAWNAVISAGLALLAIVGAVLARPR